MHMYMYIFSAGFGGVVCVYISVHTQQVIYGVHVMDFSCQSLLLCFYPTV